MKRTITAISKEPKIAKHAVDMVSRVNPKFRFSPDLSVLERQARICLGLPFKNKMGGQVPYAYEYNEETDTYEPQAELFRLLWEARRYLYTSALREVTDWLNFKASKLGFKQTITFEGLRNLMIFRPPYEEALLPINEKEKILESLCQWNKAKATL